MIKSKRFNKDDFENMDRLFPPKKDLFFFSTILTEDFIFFFLPNDRSIIFTNFLLLQLT